MKKNNDVRLDIEDDKITDCHCVKEPKKWRLVSALTIIAVIILNIAASLVFDAKLLYADMTKVRYTSGKYGVYTLSNECESLIGQDVIPEIQRVNRERLAEGQESIKLKIIFCSDRDFIESDSQLRYVSYTARALANKYSDEICVEYVNIVKNPSAVQKYKTNSAVTIYSSNVIVEFGTEFLVQRANSFFYRDSENDAPWAYIGEQRLSAMILSVTRAESPICAITNNHGETLFDADGKVKEEYTTFIKLISAAGYRVTYIDLETDEIPADCRMIITFDPQSDFKAFGDLGEENVSEIAKLDKYLDGSNSFFYICDRETPIHENLEEYLEEWGICVARADSLANIPQNYEIKDMINCTDVGQGNVVIGSYAAGGGGAAITNDMTKRAYPPKVIFGHSTAFVPSETYFKVFSAADEAAGKEEFIYYNYYRNAVNRNMYEVFSTYSTAYAAIDGESYEVATNINTFKLMTITQEERQVQETNYNSVNQASYVMALGSTDFLSNSVLDASAYGNTDVLLSALRNTGGEVIPANISLKAFYIYEMGNEAQYNSAAAYTWFACLSLIPLLSITVSGIVVHVRRKYR